MKCSTCGYENSIGSLFCANCGKQLTISQNNNQENYNQNNNQENAVTNQNNLEMYNMEKNDDIIDTNIEEIVDNLSQPVNTEKEMSNDVQPINGESVIISNSAVQSVNSEEVLNNNIDGKENIESSNNANVTQPVNNESTISANASQPVNNNDVMYNNSNLINNNQDGNKNNKKNRIIIFSIIGVILLIFIVVLCLLLLNSSPKKIFSGFTNKLYGSFEKSLKSDYNSIYMDLEISPKISGTENSELEDIVNKFSVNLSGGIDYKNKTFIYDLDANYNNKGLFKINTQYNNDLYLEFVDIYDKPIKVEESDVSDIFEKSDNNDVKIVLKGYINALNNSLEDSYFSSETEEITYDGKRINAKVITLKIDDSNINDICEKMKKELSNNDDFITSFAKINDIETSEAKETIEQSFENVYGNMNIKLYTTGISNQFVKFVIESEGTQLEFGAKENDNNYYIKIENEGIAVSIDYKYSQEYNKKIELKDVSDAVNQDEASTELLESFNKIKEKEGYIELNEDIENATGYGIEELISSLLNQSSFDSSDNYYNDYNYDYDYDYDYDYYNNYNYEYEF